jgi:hypothetical protein
MAKLTQFGRMRRRIKRELEAARAERATTSACLPSVFAAGLAQIALIKDTVITAKMLGAWKKEQLGGKLPEEESCFISSVVQGQESPSDVIVVSIEQALGGEEK